MCLALGWIALAYLRMRVCPAWAVMLADDGRAVGYLKWSWAGPFLKLPPFIVCDRKEDVASCGKPGAIGRNETGSGFMPHSK